MRTRNQLISDARFLDLKVVTKKDILVLNPKKYNGIVTVEVKNIMNGVYHCMVRRSKYFHTSLFLELTDKDKFYNIGPEYKPNNIPCYNDFIETFAMD